MPDDGLVSLRSAHSTEATIARIEVDLAAKGVTLFAKTDHAADAVAAGLALRPTTLLIFGGACAGTPLMQACQRAGIDLPLKALVWEAADGTVWLTYSEPAWIARRHALDPQTQPLVRTMSTMLAAIARYATAPHSASSGR